MAGGLRKQFAERRSRYRHLLGATALGADKVHCRVRLIALAGANHVAVVGTGDAMDEPRCLKFTEDPVDGYNIHGLSVGGKAVADVIGSKGCFG